MQVENDSELVRRAQRGDKQAFGELITRHQTMVRRVAYHLVREQELARDLAQEAWLAAYLSLAHLREPERFASWLYGITLNVCRSHWRNRNATTFSFESLAGGTRFEALPFSNEPDPQTVAETRELHTRVLDAINGLSPENRAATLLFYYDGLPLDEIAALLNISPGAVKGRLHKSRKHLRTRLFQVYAEYLAPIPGRERGKSMISVTVADVVRHERKDEESNSVPHHIVVLYDAQGQRTLPIWVGPFEAEAIAMGVMGEPTPRPMTYEFMAKLLDATSAHIQAIRVDSLQGDIFYAVVTLKQGDTTIDIDARPSDAIALGLRAGAPLFVSEALMEKSALAVPQPVNVHSPPRGIEQLAQVWQANFAASQRLRQRTPDEWKQSQQELVELVFGK